MVRLGGRVVGAVVGSGSAMGLDWSVGSGGGVGWLGWFGWWVVVGDLE